jgi:hypothetical protein
VFTLGVRVIPPSHFPAVSGYHVAAASQPFNKNGRLPPGTIKPFYARLDSLAAQNPNILRTSINHPNLTAGINQTGR